MLTPLSIVLVGIMAVQNPITKQYEIHYEPLDYYETIGECNKEQARLTKKNPVGIRYVCLTISRN